MYRDAENKISDDQAITVTAVGTNVLDLTSKIGPDVAVGGLRPLLVQVTEDFASGTSMQVILETSDEEAFGTAEIIGMSRVVLTADLVAGYGFRVAVPDEGMKRYFRARYVVVGTYTAGKVMVGFVADK